MFDKSTQSQVLYIRHGETLFNYCLEESKNKQEVQIDELFIDCSLSEKGQLQAKILGENIKNFKIAYVFCSPLNRCLETTLISIRSHPQKEKIKIIVHPELTEVVHSAQDIPKNISEKKTMFSSFSDIDFDWTYCEAGSDNYLLNLLDNLSSDDQEIRTILSETESKEGVYKKFLASFILNNRRPESLYHLYERSKNFKRFLKNFLENNAVLENEKVLVVTHSAFIRMSTTQIASKIENLDFYPEDCYKPNNCEVISLYL